MAAHVGGVLLRRVLRRLVVLHAVALHRSSEPSGCGGRGGGRGGRGDGRGVLPFEAIPEQRRGGLDDAAREVLAVDVRVEAALVARELQVKVEDARPFGCDDLKEVGVG